MDTEPRLTIRTERRRGSGRVFRRGPIWWIAYSGVGPNGRAVEVRESAKTTSEAAALELLRRRTLAVGDIRAGRMADPSKRVAPGRRRSEYRSLFIDARAGAARRDIPFALNEDDFEALVRSARDCCQVSGIPFDFERPTGRRRPFAPSLDRIDSSLGYTVENCRLVCAIVNFAMNEWGLEPLLRLAHSIAVVHPYRRLEAVR